MDEEKDIIRRIETLSQDVDSLIQREGKSVFRRYPLVFGLLGTFGIVSIIYGFEGVIDTIPFLKEHPVFLLLIGFVVLLITGTLYKRLQIK
jgi:hypothetical protein